MKAKAILLLSMTCLSIAAQARAQEAMTATTPVFGQIVTYQLPKGFQPTFEDTQGTFYVQEAVPAGESVEDWSQMITMTGFNDAGGQATMDEAAQMLAAYYQQACETTFTGTSFGPTEINGLSGLVVFLGCGTVAPAKPEEEAHSERAVIVFVKSPFGYITVQWAERLPPQDTAPVYDIETWRPRLAQLLPIQLCDVVEGEQPPYPSCTSRQ
ncbi:hypothetical protein HGO38_19370 [Rhizobium sp. CG5]|uniref:hypothetical protein n=1 Tax=Rhizobium sp. CG5 TaxID=2726076 RepID=UPI002033EB64|nr:hypothetical protein [Rhizobium sp. CG5]MCM2475638.1 hypothetical protein [Rhizobium sp. CG5]